jgi:hypothetical protein
MKTIEQEAKEYANIPLNRDIDSEERYFNDSVREYDSFIAGANSKWVQAEKVKAQIETLNILDTNLQVKVNTLTEMASQADTENFNYLNSKIGGVRLVKEEIRRDLKELEQQLKKLYGE